MDAPTSPARSNGWLAVLGPGMLVAATGVGAGDLMTASLAGAAVGPAILWAAVVGVVFKWTVNEGLARWQMATGTTLLEGWTRHFGRAVPWVFLPYFLVWSFFTGGALVTACGVAGASLMPWFDAAQTQIVSGVLHSLAGVLLAAKGGFRLFERLMAVCIGVMFAGVVVTALLLEPDWPAIFAGLFWPTIPPGGLARAMAVMGGVGGTLTLMCYGYWIREAGRQGPAGVRACRIDLSAGYVMTALFGIAMILIGSRIEVEGKGAQVAVLLADQLGTVLGPVGRWMFLLGFWGAVFSSLLGVWQGVPYLFADFLYLQGWLRAGNTVSEPDGAGGEVPADLTHTGAYRGYLVALATVPLVMLWRSVDSNILIYSVFGALFLPLVALTLLVMNNRAAWIGRGFTSGWLINAVLAITVAAFVYLGLVHNALGCP